MHNRKVNLVLKMTHHKGSEQGPSELDQVLEVYTLLHLSMLESTTLRHCQKEI